MTMDRTERFYIIERLIRTRGCVSFGALQEELSVSRATLNRDLLYLRSRMDAPIVFDHFEKGYRLAPDEADARQRNHQLPGVWFSEREIYALLTMHQLIQGLDEGGVLGRHLQPVLEKLRSMLGENETQAATLVGRIKILSPFKRPVAPKFFELIGSALVTRRRVQMRYFSRGRRVTGDRIVSPQRLVHYRNTWYLDAWCHTADGLRRFALDAIDSAAADAEACKEVAMSALEAAFDQGYGVITGGRIQWASILFDSEAAKWVSREVWHRDQRGQMLSDGNYRLEVPYGDPTELVMDILRHGQRARVESPATLRKRVIETLDQVRASYGLGHSALRDTVRTQGGW